MDVLRQKPSPDVLDRLYLLAQHAGENGVIIGLTAIGSETVRAMRFHEGGPEGAPPERYAVIPARHRPSALAARGIRPVTYDRHG